ncbi:DNA-directed RNA polymerase subunit alpha, partial [Candidatus Aerophobetes bacterium]|nr:DNA-directed RNA polymerase subunit alpha [Candidatus Aerophobetes bacterium]
VGTIFVDSIFSPVLKVKYEVLPARIGRKTSYDCLVLEIFTDGTVTPDDALNQAARILQDYARIFIMEDLEEKKKEQLKAKFLQMSVDDIGLPTVASNALKDAGIRYVKDIVEKQPKELLTIHNFGEKSLEKLKKKLAEYNLSLKGETDEASKEG